MLAERHPDILPPLTFAEAKAQLSSLIEKVLAGEDVIIGKAGKPIARLVPYTEPSQARGPGALKGKIRIADDFDTLPQERSSASS